MTKSNVRLVLSGKMKAHCSNENEKDRLYKKFRKLIFAYMAWKVENELLFYLQQTISY